MTGYILNLQRYNKGISMITQAKKRSECVSSNGFTKKVMDNVKFGLSLMASKVRTKITCMYN